MSSEAEALPLGGRGIAITGRLASMTRPEAAQLIEELGGTYHDRPTAETDTLVVGDHGWPLRDDGQPTRSLQAAEELRDGDADLEIVSETEFLASLGREEGVLQRLYTAQQLSRILEVPTARITSWVRAGLIQPVKVVRRLSWFDFRQVAGAKLLQDLVRAGVTAGRIRKSLEAIDRWMPGATASLAHLALTEEDGQLLVRLGSGALADPTGQIHFDFEAAQADGLAPEAERSSGEWFEEALRLEEAGRLAEALDAYHRSMVAGGVRADAVFNMGNVYYRLGRRYEAAQRFMQAVESDPEYVEAWNNLASTLADLDQYDGALRAYEQALALDPDYADAHYNVAESYFQLGRMDAARRHWQAYLAHDPGSRWADVVRARLAETLKGQRDR